MMIREFKITDKRRSDFGQVYEGHYLNDGTNEIEVLTPRGREVLFDWEFDVVIY